MKTLSAPPANIGKILLATSNAGKASEINSALAAVGIEAICLADLPDQSEIEETGTTFEENAELKASGYARNHVMISLADDSGLEVDTLDGRPGVYSARYGGEGSGYASKIAQLLAEIDKSDRLERSARFRCVMALADASGNVFYSADGVCEGKIADRPSGSSGFGYDPVFIPDGETRTFAEMSPSEKSSMSHRGKALFKIIQYLRGFQAI